MQTMPDFNNETLRPDGFTIDNQEKAEWYLRKLSEMEAAEARIAAQAEKMLTRVRADKERFTGRFGAQFESYFRGELERTKSRKKSIHFFHGTAQLVTVAPRLVVENVEDAITTARAVAPQTVTEETPEPITKLDKKAFLAYAAQRFEATGELLPGVTRTEGGERFSVKFATADTGEEITE